MSGFKDLKLKRNIINTAEFINPMTDMASQMRKSQEDSFKALQESRDQKEREELRRHNEMVEALKQAGKDGATIIVGDNASGVQVSQNSDASSQNMTNSNTFNYETTLDVLEEIQEYFEFPKFKEIFGTQSEEIEKIVNQTISAVKHEEDPKLIKKSLTVLKDLVVGTSGSLIASGIIGLLRSII